MDGSLNSSEVATLSLLQSRGYGVGAGDYGNFVGDGSSVKEGIRGNRDLSLLEAINSGSRNQFLSQQINQHNDAISDKIETGNQFLTDRISSQNVNERFSSVERLLFALQASNDREFRAIDVKLTECCCKLESGQASIQAKLDAQALQLAQNENNRLNMQIQIMNQSRGNN